MEKRPGEIPVKRFDNFQRIINKTTAELVGTAYDIEGVVLIG